VIHRIYSNLSTFKNLSFREGLNILIADKTPEATDRQTRTRAGKTSVIELIHFLCGANADRDSLFRTTALEEYLFGIDFDLGHRRVVVERSGKSKRNLFVVSGDTSEWPIQPSSPRTGKRQISNTDWKAVLGAIMFGTREAEEESAEGPISPTFRSLFGYFVRRQQANAFTTPEKNVAMQQLGDQQVAIIYLLGLDWTIARDWQTVRDREKTLRELRKAASEGAFGPIIGTAADLRTQLAVVEDRAGQLRQNLAQFRVLPEYESLEIEASSITRELSSLADQNTVDRHLLADLEDAIESEIPPPPEDLARLYEEAGIALPSAVVRRFDEVKAFHDSVLQNRRDYLSGEINAAKQRIAAREQAKSQLDGLRAEVMGILQSHGALDQFLRLHTELSRDETATESLRQRYEAAEQLEGRKAELEIERNQLLLRLRQDFHEQTQALNDAILAFESISNRLLESAGSLVITESLNGPTFEAKIQGSRSKGIKNMQIFCFDMMLMQVCGTRGLGPGFLVHDSHLFDGVDERQVAKALQIGAQLAEELGFQYIVTMNSDDLHKAESTGFDSEKYLLPVQLTDAQDDGGLFGFRF
jgi:uncharacterized protein YydD (DUF2326 family)